ncbi:Transcriptional regulator, TetR family [Nostocoides japonicum T1-X7]|uniref:Transcriptional regulator, TetR family n=1 Tax=Nostocoides japonicum T1-X7 TaxID=1194083 RepID=A0A077M6Q4_9MICO|nr:TetR/AcrR family transcriptional regulator [Tetrasphaera japonica]CCH79854.1 Transcriptional regulator, TetR family [Tetrasphaera japonica T1-X7]
MTAAAIRVADRDGLDAMTMASVATELGTAPASLYRHVESRDELIDLMVDDAAGAYDLRPASGDWVADLTELAMQGVAIHRHHPWLHDVVDTPTMGPNALALTEAFLGILHDHPASGSQKLVAFAVWNSLIGSFARSSSGRPASDRARRQAAYLGQVVTAERYPHLASVVPTGSADPDDLFPTVVDGVMRGLLGG